MSTQYPRASTPQASGNRLWDSPWTDQPRSLAPGNLPVCEEGCSLHSETVHDAVKVMMHYSSIPLKFLDREWDPENPHELIAFHQVASTGNPWPIGGTAEELRHLPMAPTRLNGELLRICKYDSPGSHLLTHVHVLRTHLEELALKWYATRFRSQTSVSVQGVLGWES
jgi:hypothetical protein